MGISSMLTSYIKSQLNAFPKSGANSTRRQPRVGKPALLVVLAGAEPIITYQAFHVVVILLSGA